MSESFELSTDSWSRRVILLAALALILTPFLQAGAQIWPIQWDNIQWRFSAANALSSVLLLPFIGAAMLVLLARASDDRGLGLTVGAFCTVMTLGLGASLVLFGLDASQLKSIVSTRMTQTFNITALRVGAVSTMFALFFLILAIAGFRVPGTGGRRTEAPRASAGRSGKRDEEDVGLLVGVRND